VVPGLPEFARRVAGVAMDRRIYMGVTLWHIEANNILKMQQNTFFQALKETVSMFQHAPNNSIQSQSLTKSDGGSMQHGAQHGALDRYRACSVDFVLV